MGARSSKEEEEKDGGGQWAVGTEMYRLQAAPTSSRACCDMHEVVVTLCCRDDKRPVREQMRSHSKTIEGLMLSPKEAQVVAYCVNKTYEMKTEANGWAKRGLFVYLIKVLSAALVPVLVSTLGSFESDTANTIVQVTSITLSITGTVSQGEGGDPRTSLLHGHISASCCSRFPLLAALEDVYQWRALGNKRYEMASKMQVCLN